MFCIDCQTKIAPDGKWFVQPSLRLCVLFGLSSWSLRKWGLLCESHSNLVNFHGLSCKKSIKKYLVCRSNVTSHSYFIFKVALALCHVYTKDTVESICIQVAVSNPSLAEKCNLEPTKCILFLKQIKTAGDAAVSSWLMFFFLKRIGWTKNFGLRYLYSNCGLADESKMTGN